MELREFLFRQNCSIQHMSDLLWISRTHLSNIVRKKQRPSLKLAKEIEKLTRGEVTIYELRGEIKNEHV